MKQNAPRVDESKTNASNCVLLTKRVHGRHIFSNGCGLFQNRNSRACSFCKNNCGLLKTPLWTRVMLHTHTHAQRERERERERKKWTRKFNTKIYRSNGGLISLDSFSKALLSAPYILHNSLREMPSLSELWRIYGREWQFFHRALKMNSFYIFWAIVD